jgi:hypothetical protein
LILDYRNRFYESDLVSEWLAHRKDDQLISVNICEPEHRRMILKLGNQRGFRKLTRSADRDKLAQESFYVHRA